MIRMPSWWTLRRTHTADRDEALAARMEAVSQHMEALDRYTETTAQVSALRAMTRRNHFSESLTRAFGGAP